MTTRKDLTNLKIAAGCKKQERTYWLNQLSGEWKKAGLPCLSPCLTGPFSHSQTEEHNFKLRGTLFSGLTKWSQGSDVRLHILLSSMVTLLLAVYTQDTNRGERDIITGTPVMNTGNTGDLQKLLNTI